MRQVRDWTLGIFSIIVITVVLFIALYGCTINLVQTDTHGEAEDVSDVTSSDALDVKASLK